jgi:general transcription factor IIIA
LTCLAGPENIPSYFPTWSALQHHIRTTHPPTCTHPSCHGRTFTSQKGLRAHQKLHEERELEEEMVDGIIAEHGDIDSMQPPVKRRRGGEIGRDWKCDVDNCDKDFKSVSVSLTLNNLVQHVCVEKGTDESYKCHPSWTT